ncbi:MAG TPA: CheR family methyltransferase [Myxococcales bacterium]|jgi:chemotaxis protein methyltransferase CheR
MMPARVLEAATTDVASRLVGHVAHWTGFDERAVREESLRAALAPLLAAGESPGSILERAGSNDRELMDLLSQAALVGESYFFRQPEHFQFVAATLAPAWASEGRFVRAWCAGCSTGEEAYSLAAILEAAGVRRFQVLGTDLLARNVGHAREGLYGPWSLRPGGPLLCDPFQPGSSARDGWRVRRELRERTEFRVHNLLSAAPDPGRFDLVFCRNVLIYFSPASSARVRALLAGALAEGGALVFAAMDVASPPPGLVRRGPPEHQIYVRPGPGSDSQATPPLGPAAPMARPPRRRVVVRGSGAYPPPRVPLAAAAEPAASSRKEIDPVATHVRALGLLERGERVAAERLLADLRAAAPGYVPGLLESALLCAREGRKSAAVALMREVLERTFALPGDDTLDGPEPLPAGFYASAARAFLDAELRR